MICRDCFQEFGTVERVKKIKDYAFIHYEDREQAVQGNSFIHLKNVALDKLNDRYLFLFCRRFLHQYNKTTFYFNFDYDQFLKQQRHIHVTQSLLVYLFTCLLVYLFTCK